MSENGTDKDSTNVEPKPEPKPEPESEVDLVNKRNEDEKLNKILRFNSIYYLFIFFIIGVPIWYFTVSTYRSSLPFDEIDRLASLKKFDIHLTFELILNTPDKETVAANFQKLLSQSSVDEEGGLAFRFKTTTREFNKFELESALESKAIEDLDKKLTPENQELDTLRVYVLDNSYVDTLNIEKGGYLLLNNLYILAEDLLDVSDVTSFIKNKYLHVRRLAASVKSNLNIQNRKLPTKEELKVVNFANEYEIVFSLINSKPDTLSGWNVEECVAKYFQKVIDQLKPYTNFTVKAQTLLYSEFDRFSVPVTRDPETNEPYFYLKPSDLSMMTNHFENRLGSHISDSSTLEFITYVPPKGPLFVKSDPKDPDSMKTNAFLVPKWGGVYIYNHQSGSESTSIKINEGMKYFLTQFIDLVGIQLNENPRVIRSQIYSTEVYYYLLSNTMSNLLTSINTLKSLSSLLTTIQEMVILDKIAMEVKASVEAAQRCVHFLNEANIEEAFFQSKVAFTSSEKAFFDSSLLGQLYFPEDQRFAIYIPLFIPVGIPMILSAKTVLLSFVEKYKANRKKVKSE